jgi:hypothetical protein
MRVNGELSGISRTRPPSLRFGAPVRGVRNTEGWPRRSLAKSGRRHKLVHRLAYNSDVVAFKMDRRQGTRRAHI